jgi:8-amino-3,8-dideoxy-alpha-D-manno-octulosonate transaminase
MPGPGSYLIGQEEIDEVLEVLRSRQLSRYSRYALGVDEGWSEDDPRRQGKVYQLEQAFSDWSQTPHAIAMNSGTSALWVALMGLGVGPGDEVIVPGYTFIASMSSIAFARAIPVLAEVDDTLNLDPSDVEARITPRTKAIMVVHAGNPPECGASNVYARPASGRGLRPGDGREVPRRPVGSMGAAGAFSQRAHTTAGDGGMLITHDQRCTAGSSHSMIRVPRFRRDRDRQIVRSWDLTRMTEVQAPSCSPSFASRPMLAKSTR